jgi:colanic acid/amylovoran biosynthesis glycosyltransferase
MQKKVLVLLCDSYPYFTGEFFIDDEMRIISGSFEKIYIITNNLGNPIDGRFIPENAVILPVSPQTGLIYKLKVFPSLFTSFFMDEMRFALMDCKMKFSFMLIKVIYMDIVKSVKYSKVISNLIIKENLKPENLILYSYWHDYRALAISKMTNTYNISSVARAHRWDIYFEVNKFQYLPFKKYILEKLNISFPVSEDGKKVLERINDKKGKIIVSKLGKINSRTPVLEKKLPASLFAVAQQLQR